MEATNVSVVNKEWSSSAKIEKENTNLQNILGTIISAEGRNKHIIEITM